MTATFDPKANMVFCRKYKQDLPKMPNPPFPNKKGRILNTQCLKRLGMNG